MAGHVSDARPPNNYVHFDTRARMRIPHPQIAPHLIGVRFIDDLPRIDVRKLEVLDPLFTGQTPTCTLRCHNRPCGTVAIEVGDARLHVRSLRLGLNLSRGVGITIKLHFFAMPHSGSRPAFFCPLCDRTAPLLFVAGLIFACRHCVALPYRSQNVGPLDRRSGMAARIRKRLFLGPYDSMHLAKRPKHMKRSTFDRLKWEIEMRERRALLAAYFEFFRRQP